MRHAHPTSIVATSGSRAQDAGARAVLVLPAGSRTGDMAMHERTLTHTFSSPVVRELLPNQARAIATW